MSGAGARGDSAEAVKETSFITAVIRATEHDRPDRYLTDRHAASLSTPRSRRMAAEALAAGGTIGSVIVRGRFGDIALEQAVADGITQVVCLAAGSDTRAWRLGLPARARFFEIDLPGQLAAKEALLAPVADQLTCSRTALDEDLRGETWPRRLRDAGYATDRPAVWIVEGLVPYLGVEQFTRLLTRIGALSSSGSVLLVDAPHPAYVDDAANARFLGFMESRGSAFRPGPDDFGGLLERHGWRAEAYTLSGLAAGACAWLPAPPDRLCPSRDHHWVVRAHLA